VRRPQPFVAGAFARRWWLYDSEVFEMPASPFAMTGAPLNASVVDPVVVKPSFVMLSELTVADVGNDGVKVVRNRDCEGFVVKRCGRSSFSVHSRTHFLCGMRVVHSFAQAVDVMRTV
jgi:hypothetical protein